MKTVHREVCRLSGATGRFRYLKTWSNKTKNNLHFLIWVKLPFNRLCLNHHAVQFWTQLQFFWATLRYSNSSSENRLNSWRALAAPVLSNRKHLHRQMQDNCWTPFIWWFLLPNLHRLGTQRSTFPATKKKKVKCLMEHRNWWVPL